jgi:hypothetical protein
MQRWASVGRVLTVKAMRVHRTEGLTPEDAQGPGPVASGRPLLTVTDLRYPRHGRWRQLRSWHERYRHRALLTGLAAGGVIAGVPLAWLAFVLQGSAAARSDFGMWLAGVLFVIAVSAWAAMAVVLKPRGRGDGG